MALRLGEYVECGELLNTRNYSTHGWIKLRGHDEPLRLELTGNPDPDLRGCHIQFEARDDDPDDIPPDAISRTSPKEVDEKLLEGLAWQQIGPTGNMTAARKVKVTDCSVEELCQRCKLGEPPPFTWKPLLYLEWYSQNGRVVIEMADPIIEFIEGDGGQATEEPVSDEELEEAAGGFSVTAVQIDEDGEVHTETFTAEDLAEEADEDPYGLLPDDLQRQLDRDARDTDRALGGDDDVDEVMRETELMDDLIEHLDGEPLLELLHSPKSFPPPDKLADDEAEGALKTLLGELALFGIALDVCEHYAPRDAYRLLVEEILPNESAYRELQGTQWVQHFSTYEHCEQCEAELEREWQERERQGEDESDDEPPSGASPADAEQAP